MRCSQRARKIKSKDAPGFQASVDEATSGPDVVGLLFASQSPPQMLGLPERQLHQELRLLYANPFGLTVPYQLTNSFDSSSSGIIGGGQAVGWSL